MHTNHNMVWNVNARVWAPDRQLDDVLRIEIQHLNLPLVSLGHGTHECCDANTGTYTCIYNYTYIYIYIIICELCNHTTNRCDSLLQPCTIVGMNSEPSLPVGYSCQPRYTRTHTSNGHVTTQSKIEGTSHVQKESHMNAYTKWMSVQWIKSNIPPT